MANQERYGGAVFNHCDKYIDCRDCPIYSKQPTTKPCPFCGLEFDKTDE